MVGEVRYGMKIEDCDIQLRVLPGPSQQDVEMVLWPREELNELQRPRPDGLLAHIANVVNHGGLCGVANTPASSSLVVQGSEPSSGPMIRRLFRIQGVDPGAWRVILGSYIGASVRGFPLHRIEMSSQTENRVNWFGAAEAFQAPYPEHAEPLPFEVERSVSGSSTKDRLIQIC